MKRVYYISKSTGETWYVVSGSGFVSILRNRDSGATIDVARKKLGQDYVFSHIEEDKHTCECAKCKCPKWTAGALCSTCSRNYHEGRPVVPFEVSE